MDIPKYRYSEILSESPFFRFCNTIICPACGGYCGLFPKARELKITRYNGYYNDKQPIMKYILVDTCDTCKDDGFIYIESALII